MSHPEVWLEFLGPEGWGRAGSVCGFEPPGSVSSEDWSGRQVYLFGWWEGPPGVWRSAAGLDIETVAWRQVETTGLERLADLTQGPYEIERGYAGRRQKIRFRLVAE